MENIGIHSRISEITKRFPDKISIECGVNTITYKNLEDKYNEIAFSLHNHATEQKNVIIFMDKGIELILSILGTLKAGYVFVPIDVNQPNSRIKNIIEESNAKWVITIFKFVDRLNEIISNDEKINVLITDIEANQFDSKENNKFEIIHVEKSVPDEFRYTNEILNKYCYIYFTSGSSGKPKGVLGRHRSLKHFIDWEIKEFGVNDKFRVSQLTSPSFDPFLRDVFVPLCVGGTLCIPETREILLEPVRLINWIKESNITLIHMVPSIFRILSQNIKDLNCFSKLKYILLAGELLKGNDIKNFIQMFDNRIQLVNIYGPTETTMAKMFYRISKEDVTKNIIPVGIPIANTEVMILDDNMKKCPLGSVGDVYIRTPYISSGYYNDPELTKKVFIKNPYGNNPQDIIYKTGDIGRLLIDGNMELLGRKDNQVKISGVRIELGEIENALQKHELIKEAVVIAKEDSMRDKYLCCYITGTESINVVELKEFLLITLPDYMIPKYFIQLEKIPLTLNGKVDKKQLPEPEKKFNSGVNYVAPRNNIEKKLVEVWKTALEIENIGIYDNFFNLGGNSLKAIQVFSTLSKEFKIKINDIFKYKTISELAENIQLSDNNIMTKLARLKGFSDTEFGSDLFTDEMKSKFEEYKRENNKYYNMNLKEKNNYKNILLAGATGFLGIHVFYELLRKTDANIYVLIRGNTSFEAEKRFRNKFSYYYDDSIYESSKKRIIVINGDLTKENFELEPEYYHNLSEKIDCIVNSAANVRHYGHYSEFYEINVNGTSRLIKFALEGKNKQLNHISTTGVARGTINNNEYVLFTENDCDLGQAIESPYNLTKLESEKLILEARKLGLNCNIMRVGNLVFNSKTGIFQENILENGLYALIKTCIKLKTLPRIQNRFLEFSYVDYVSQVVVSLMNIKELRNEIYHIYNTNYDSIIGLGEYLIDNGYDLKLESPKIFIEYLAECYRNENLRTYVDEILLHSRMLENTNTTIFHMISNRTTMILDQLDFKWPEFNKNLAKKMVDHCEKVGFFK